MRRLSAILTVLVVAGVTFAQTPQSGTEGVVIRQRMVQGPDGAPPPPPLGDLLFISSESFGGKVVKGAPYSADAVTESIQVLGDGNRIVNKFTSTVYRDGEGRTRREQTLKGLGVLGTGTEPLQTIFINDPVAGVTFSLDTRARVALKSTPFKFEFTQKGGAAGTDAEGRHFEFKVAPGGGAPGANVTMIAPLPVPPGAPGTPGTRVALTQTEQFTIATGGGAGASSYVFKKAGPNPNEVKEDLGKQMIEGVQAEGSRTTVTIAAGEIGNERPIEIVSERWFSPELQLVVMTRHSDPRTGETTYKLTNINRTEPAKSLFEVPSDYTIKEGMHSGPPLPARMKKLANPE
ncbi:MAG TPA: hypothetical protein VJS17_08140 [Pyrinomonadaceae bacterium]|nr:hypothetical protein [Pyrinomonadaceae bacterium]